MELQKSTKTNQFYADIIDLFNSREFVKIRNNYMTNTLDADTVFMYLLLMIYIHRTYPDQDPAISLGLIHKLIGDHKTRSLIVKNVYKVFQNANENITQLLEFKRE